MPSDQDENRAVWQNANALEWETPVAQVPQVASVPSNVDVQFADAQYANDDQSIVNAQYADDALNTDDLLTPDTESDLLPWTRPALISKETLGTFWRQLAPILVPLPFALLVFVSTLPATLQGLSAHHPSVLIMGILLLAIMILQGTLLYFAGSNDTLLTLYIVGGYALFIVTGVFAAFGPVPALITLGVLLLLGVFLARRGIHPTREGFVDIVTSYGKYSHTLYPGLNLLLPWEQVSLRLNTQETTWTTPRMDVLTSRDQTVQLTATISYQLMPEDAHLAALGVKDWEGSLHNLFKGTVQSLVNELTLADFVAWTQSVYTRTPASDTNSFNPAAATRWDRINSTLSRRMQDVIASWGVQVNWVRIQDLTLLPNAHGRHAPLANGDTGGTTQIMKDEPILAPVPAPPRRQEKVEKAQTPPKPADPAPGPPKVAPAGKMPKVEMLVDMYNAVRQNVITDPAVITDLALRFESLANDPVANKTIDFDAERAAKTLRQRAQRMQDAQSAGTEN